MSIARKVLMGSSGGKKSTYVDDVFSTQIYDGNQTAGRLINNGIDLAGEGGLVWTKIRNNGYSHALVDTERGATKVLRSERDNHDSVDANTLTGFNDNGYTLGADTSGWVNYGSGSNYSSWSFRKSPGFFDVVTWTGNATAGRQIAHNLKCKPGRIIIKCSSKAGNWQVHDPGADYTGVSFANLNANGQFLSQSSYFSSPATSTHLTLGAANEVNENGESFVAYIFAGSDRSGNRSIEFDGQSGYITVGNSNQWNFGSGEFTVECWVKTGNTGDQAMVNLSNGGATSDSGWILYQTGQKISFYITTGTSWNHFSYGNVTISDGNWHHLAVTRTGNDFKFWVDGTQDGGFTYSGSIASSSRVLEIGAQNQGATGSTGGRSYIFDGHISNVRVIKGQALYTSNFTPSTTPLTMTSQGATQSNVGFLGCNDIGPSQATWSAWRAIGVWGGTSGGFGVRGSSESPFGAATSLDESAVFGADEDKPIIRTGVYQGSGVDGNEVKVGFEPQYLMIKNEGGTGHWYIFDAMRGVVTGGDDERLQADEVGQGTDQDNIEFMSTGFRLPNTNSWINGPARFTYMAIRRSDGYVGKPVEAGTDVFTTVYGNSGGTNPSFVTNFVVDSALNRTITGSESWYVTSRLTRDRYMVTNGTAAETSASTFKFDHSNGWRTGGAVPAYLSWNWKRHAGMDVVGYTGAGAFSSVPHSLSKIPEMMWVKKRNATENWIVYHKDLNGGTTPENYYLELNTQDAEATQQVWNQTAPTSTNFTVGGGSWVNGGGQQFIAWLFASVTGVSKVGSFAGSSSDVTLNLGFVPRFLMVKGRTGPSGTNWTVWDNVRGITGGGADTPRMYLNAQSASSAGANDNVFTVDSGGVKGITIVTGPTWNNHQDYNYIYYAHA